MKKIITLIVVVAVVAAGVCYWKYGSAEEETEEPETATAKIARGPITLNVSTTGRVVSNLDVEIKCRAGGEVVSLPYDVSDNVEKGKLLVEIDPVYEQRNLDQAKVSLAASEAQLTQAKLNLSIAEKNLELDKQRANASLQSASAKYKDSVAKAERLRQLLEKKLSSQEEYDTANASAIQAASELENANIRLSELKIEEVALELKNQDVLLAESRVSGDRIELSDAEQRLKDTKVYAPMDGVVSARNVQIGQIISSAISNVGGGTTVLTLSDLSRIFILASVDESDIGKVKVGHKAEITADAFPGLPFRGEVVRIATRGVTSSNVVTFEVKIEVLSRNKKMLKPEMTANVEIIAEHREDAVIASVEALRRKMGGYTVQVVKPDGSTEERPVETGITDGVNTEIISGLEEGETIIINKGEADSRWRTSQQDRRRRHGPGAMFRRRDTSSSK